MNQNFEIVGRRGQFDLFPFPEKFSNGGMYWTDSPYSRLEDRTDICVPSTTSVTFFEFLMDYFLSKSKFPTGSFSKFQFIYSD